MDSAKLRQLIIPTWGQVIACKLLALGILGLAFWNVAYDALIRYSAVTPADIDVASHARLSYFNSFAWVRTGVVAAFWVGVAIVVYIVYLAISNAVIDARNEVTIKTKFTGQTAWWDFGRRPLWQSLAAIALFGLLVVTAQFLLSVWFSLFTGFLQGPTSALGLLRGLGAIVGLATNLYIIWIAAQAVFARY